MPIASELQKYLIISAIIGASVIMIGYMTTSNKSNIVVNVKVPSFSDQALLGQKSFTNNCASCHGQNAAGSMSGPPLIHKIYEPSHHSDGAFQLAVKRGVKAHHWKFGYMPAQLQVNQSDTKLIIHYVRELQRANGIF